MKIKTKMGAILLVLFIFLLPAPAGATTVSDVSSQVICQCGCTLVLENCTHEECHSRDNMTALIAQQLDQGKSGEEIVQLFVTRYGEQVLASPPKKGFNLTAWVLPFASILFGAAVIYILIRKWVRTGQYSPVAVKTGDDESDADYERRLEAELKAFTERSFR